MIEVGRQHDTACVECSLLLGQKILAADIAVAILGLAVFEVDAVQHAVAVEPVMEILGRLLGIGSVADIGPVEVAGNLTDHFTVDYGALFVGWRKQVLQIRIQITLRFINVGVVHGLLLTMRWKLYSMPKTTHCWVYDFVCNSYGDI